MEADDGGTIRQLPEEVINRIAAGEVVQRPASAVKELIENSLDAGAERVDVIAQEGGVLLLRIEDNGHGIAHADFPLLCKRFATSKLRSFDDLKSIATFGFRGEALASLSMVSRLDVTSRSKRDPSGTTWRARYLDGDLTSCEECSPGLQEPGTVLRATDLFYTNPQRREVLARAQEEYRHVLEVITKYALHHPSVRFGCRKSPTALPCLATRPSDSRASAVRQIYGRAVHDALLPVTLEHKAASSGSMDFTARMLVTSAKYIGAKLELVLFINGRLVEHDGIARAVKNLYGEMLPKKAYPFVYMDITLPPDKVDVNAHPSKEKVIFLHEDDVVARVEKAIAPVLAETRDERNTGSLHLKRKLSEDDGGFGLAPAKKLHASTSSTDKPERTRSLDYELIRTDSTLEHGAIDQYVTRGVTAAEPSQAEGGGPAVPQSVSTATFKAGLCAYSPARLSSAQLLLDRAAAAADEELHRELQQMVFVGWVNHRYSLVQLGLGLWQVDLSAASFEVFYQLLLAKIGGGLARIRLRPAVSVTQLLRHSVSEAGGDDSDVERLMAVLRAQRDVLDAYCSTQLNDADELASLPVLLAGYVPPLQRLPRFLHRLATCVDWSREVTAVRGLAEEYADLYSLPLEGYDRPVPAAEAAAPLVALAAAVAAAAGRLREEAAAEPPSVAVPISIDSDEEGDAEAGHDCGSHSHSHSHSHAPVGSLALPADLSDSDEEHDAGREAALAAVRSRLSQAPAEQIRKPDRPAAAVGSRQVSDASETDASPAVPADDLIKGIWSARSAKWTAQYRLLRVFRSVAPPRMWREGKVLRKVADLRMLYRIFERC